MPERRVSGMIRVNDSEQREQRAGPEGARRMDAPSKAAVLPLEKLPNGMKYLNK